MTNATKKLGAFHAPLKPNDTETQTEGCRYANPDICGRHSIPKVCAFVREDGLCLKPSLAWPKQFRLLRGDK